MLLTTLLWHSIIFYNAMVQFLKDDLELIEAIFAKASVRPCNIVLPSCHFGSCAASSRQDLKLQGTCLFAI